MSDQTQTAKGDQSLIGNGRHSKDFNTSLPWVSFYKQKVRRAVKGKLTHALDAWPGNTF